MYFKGQENTFPIIKKQTFFVNAKYRQYKCIK